MPWRAPPDFVNHASRTGPTMTSLANLRSLPDSIPHGNILASARALEWPGG